MRRNVSFRVEVVASIEDKKIKAQLWQCLQMCLSENALAWHLLPDGTAQAPSGGGDVGHQESLLRIYEAVAAQVRVKGR
jgi:polyphosphate kinase